MSVEVTALPDRLLGLPGFVVLSAARVADELEVLVETAQDLTGCPRCGVVAAAHGRRPHQVRDVPAYGVPVLLTWVKRLWRCAEPACVARTWSETSAQVRAKATLTERARSWACARVGRDGATVAQVARELGVGWSTVMRAVHEYGTPMIDGGARLDGVTAVGVDEHVWGHAGPWRRTVFATAVVDITPGRPARLLDLVQGRTGTVLGDWLHVRDQVWREHVAVAALDPFRGYATALSEHLPAATRVLDAFHVVKLANQALDEVRRDVQQASTGHRGYAADPLYRVRRLLRKGEEHLTDSARAKVHAALAAGDPDGVVNLAWQVAQRVRSIYHAPTPNVGRARAEHLLEVLHTCPIPQLARLGRTLRAWRRELLAYFDTDGASNGPTEATNLVIEKNRRTAHGYRNFDNYRLRLLLHSGVTWHTPTTRRIRTRTRPPRLVA